MSTVVPLRLHRFLNVAGIVVGLFLLVYVVAYLTDFKNARPITAAIDQVAYKKDYKDLDVVTVVFAYQDEQGHKKAGQIKLLKMALDKRIVSDNQIKLRQSPAGHFYPDTYHELRCLAVAVIIWWGMMVWSFGRYRAKLKGAGN